MPDARGFSAGAAGPGAGLFLSATRRGRRTLKHEPLPTSLVTVMSPPIIWQKRRLMTRPRPVPPYLREVEASACTKAWNSLPSCSGLRPMPVSLTWKASQGVPSGPVSRSTSSETVPWSVNLLAFESRLKSTWRRRVMSACIGRRSSGQRTSRVLAFFSISG